MSKVLLYTAELEVDKPVRDGDLDAMLVKKVITAANKPYPIRHTLGRVPRRVVILQAVGGYPVLQWTPDANGFPQADEEQIVVQFSATATVILQIA